MVPVLNAKWILNPRLDHVASNDDPVDIFRKKWGDFFVNRFPNQQEARASFISKLKDTQSIRHKVAHMRSGVTKDEITTLKALRETSRNLLHP